MTNVLVGRKRQIQVNTNATAGIIDSMAPVTLKNSPSLGLIGSGIDRLDHLRDVNALNEIDGATLVYDSATDTYIVKVLDLSYATGTVDGGTF